MLFDTKNLDVCRRKIKSHYEPIIITNGPYKLRKINSNCTSDTNTLKY